MPVPIAAPRPVTPLGIIASKLAELSTRLDAIDDIDASLKSELRDACDLASGLEPYLARCTTPESPALQRLDQRTRAQEWGHRSPALEQEMLSGHVEGQTLRFLVHLTRARRVLEVGMFTGYSALAMAEALPDGGEIVACEVDPTVAELARECFRCSPSADKITVRVGLARDTLDQLAAAGAAFDLIFIDADKAGYLGYLEQVLSRDLLAPEGVVCVDNTLMQGQPYAAGVPTPNGVAIAAFNLAVAADARVEQVLIPLRDGLTLIRRISS